MLVACAWRIGHTRRLTLLERRHHRLRAGRAHVAFAESIHHAVPSPTDEDRPRISRHHECDRVGTFGVVQAADRPAGNPGVYVAVHQAVPRGRDVSATGAGTLNRYRVHQRIERRRYVCMLNHHDDARACPAASCATPTGEGGPTGGSSSQGNGRPFHKLGVTRPARRPAREGAVDTAGRGGYRPIPGAGAQDVEVICGLRERGRNGLCLIDQHHAWSRSAAPPAAPTSEGHAAPRGRRQSDGGTIRKVESTGTARRPARDGTTDPRGRRRHLSITRAAAEDCHGVGHDGERGRDGLYLYQRLGSFRRHKRPRGSSLATGRATRAEGIQRSRRKWQADGTPCTSAPEPDRNCKGDVRAWSSGT